MTLHFSEGKRNGRDLPIPIVVKKVCSWCNLVISRGTTQEVFVSHTICSNCIKKVDREIQEYQRRKELGKPFGLSNPGMS